MGLSRRGFLKRLGAAGVMAAFGVYGIKVEPDNVEENYFRIETAKLRARMRLVHITDTHVDNDRGREHVPEMVNRLNPDIIVMTGDYTNPPHDIYLKRFEEFTNRLRAKRGIYASFGNWDAGFENRIFRNTAVKTLRDSLVRIDAGGNSVDIVGMNFLYDSVPATSINRLLEGAGSGGYTIFLYHSPDLIGEVADTKQMDLYLSGHTHGGVVRLPFLKAFEDPACRGRFPYSGALLMPFTKYGRKYDQGLYRVGETTLYVNKGLGVPGNFPLRFNCRPEIAIFDIGPKEYLHGAGAMNS